MFSNKIVRCSILDRQDDLKEALYWQETEKRNIVKFEEAVKIAEDNLNKHLKRIEERQKHIDYLESVSDIKWIENPPY